MIADAPGHGRALHNPGSSSVHDRYFDDGDPDGHTASSVIAALQGSGIDMVLCHIGDAAQTMGKVFEQEFNAGKVQHQLTQISLVDTPTASRFHVIFCLDESGSMSNPWQALL